MLAALDTTGECLPLADIVEKLGGSAIRIPSVAFLVD
jgi:hypothetical protein